MPSPRTKPSRTSPGISLQDVPFGQLALLVFAMMFGKHYRAREAGPYVSVMLDVLPTLAALTVIVLSSLNLRSHLAVVRAWSLFFILLAGGVIVKVITLFLRHWSSPYARGDL